MDIMVRIAVVVAAILLLIAFPLIYQMLLNLSYDRQKLKEQRKRNDAHRTDEGGRPSPYRR